MKTGEVAKMLNVSRKTIANWTMIPELRRFFSEGALRGADEGTTSQRDFNDQDVVVLNTIRIKKTRTNTWSDVAKLLQTGEREEQLPASALLVETLSPVDQMQMLMVARKDLEVAQQRIEDLEERLAESERLRKEDREGLQQEIIKLNRQIAVLEYRLDETEDDE